MKKISLLGLFAALSLLAIGLVANPQLHAQVVVEQSVGKSDAVMGNATVIIDPALKLKAQGGGAGDVLNAEVKCYKVVNGKPVEVTCPDIIIIV